MPDIFDTITKPKDIFDEVEAPFEPPRFDAPEIADPQGLPLPTAPVELPEQKDFGLRPGGTEKGEGFLGILKTKGGDITSEYSVGVQLESRDMEETNIPTLVPTLTKEEIELMVNDIIPNKKPVPDKILQKAVDHANKRIRAGNSPFKTEQPVDIFDEIKTAERPGLIMRGLKRFAGSFVDTLASIRTKSNAGKTLTGIAAFGERIGRAIDAGLIPEKGGLKEYLALPEETRNQLAGGETLEDSLIRIEQQRILDTPGWKMTRVPAGETFAEKAVDVGAGVTGFITKIALTKKVMGIPKGSLAGDVMSWEMVNLADDGPPGAGAAMRLILGATGKIPAVTKTAKLGKLGVESSLFAGIAAAGGADTEGVIIAALVPVAFQGIASTKGRISDAQMVKSWRQRLPFTRDIPLRSSMKMARAMRATNEIRNPKNSTAKKEVMIRQWKKRFSRDVETFLKQAHTEFMATGAGEQPFAQPTARLTGEAPPEAPATAAEPTAIVKPPAIPAKVAEKPKITPPAKDVKPEKVAKPLQEQAVTEGKPQEPKVVEGEVELAKRAQKHKTVESFKQDLREEVSKKFGIEKPTDRAVEEHFESLQKGIRGGAAIELVEDLADKGMTANKAPQELLDKTFPNGKVPEKITVFRNQPTKRPLVSGDFVSLDKREASSFSTGKIQQFEVKPENLVLTNKPTESLFFDPTKKPPKAEILTIEEFFKQAQPPTKPAAEGEVEASLDAAEKTRVAIAEKDFDERLAEGDIEGARLVVETLRDYAFSTDPKQIGHGKGINAAADRLEAKAAQPPTPAAEEKPITVEKPIDVKTKIPKAPKIPVTEQEPTIPLKGKESQVFREEVKTQEKITAAEEGEVGIEPAGASFTDHIDTFHTYQLPETSNIPRITKEIKKINGLRLAGKITPQQANKRIYNLRQLLLGAAIKEKIALRVNKKGKVKIALRESGVFVPEEVAAYKKYKNIQPIIGGGQDITRAVQQMDGSLTVKEKLQTKGQAGPIERFVLWRTRKMTLQKLNWLKEKTIELRSILESKKGSKKDKEINLVLEKIGKADRDKPIKDVLSKKTLASFSKESVKAAQELRQLYDDMIEEQNAARLMRGQDEIPYRQNYSPNILRDTTVWEQLFLRDKTAKVIEQKDLPDYIKPNAPFNPRAEAREADIPYDKRILSARELAESYAITAAKDIFNTSIIQNNKAFIDQLKGQGLDKSAEYLGEWTATSFASIKPRLDRAIKLPKWAQFGLRYFNRLRNMAVFPFNVAWSLSTQPLSLSNTIGRYGLPNTVKGFFQWLKPSVRKQAAQDYFSFIVKTTKRGGVTRQDAANLLGENIKTQKSVKEFVENFSTILLTEMEKLLTGMSIRAAHIQGKKRGLKGEALKNFASDGGAKTQSMYNDEDKPMILRSLLVKSGAPYQTYAFEVANTFREWAGKTGTPPDSKLYAMWSATRWLAAMIVLRMLANRVRGKQWSWWDLIPIPFREFWLSPIARKLTGEFIPGSSGLPSPIETATKVAKGVDDVLETGNWRKLRNETLRYTPGIVFVPGGVQISRMTDAIITYSSGGLTDRRGKVLFEMEDPEDLARAMFSGVWTTKEAQALLEKRRGKKKKEPKPDKFKF